MNEELTEQEKALLNESLKKLTEYCHIHGCKPCPFANYGECILDHFHSGLGILQTSDEILHGKPCMEGGETMNPDPIREERRWDGSRFDD